MHSQHNAGELLERSEDIAQVMPKALVLVELRRLLTRLLPESLARSCAVANARQGKLVVFAENSVIAAKLKLLAPALRNQLLEAGHEVTSVVIEVQPPRNAASGAVLHKPRLSVAAGAALRACSDRLPESPLKNALQRLANRAGSR